MARNKQFSENNILEKAMLIFWEKGYHATTVRDLVAMLKINRASLYATYGGKKELFIKAFNLYKKQKQKEIWDDLAKHNSVKNGLRDLFMHSVKASACDKYYKGCFAANCAGELLPGDEEFLELLTDNMSEFEDFIFKYLYQGQVSGEIALDKDIKAISGFLFTFYNGLQIIEKINHDECSLSSLVEIALSILD